MSVQTPDYRAMNGTDHRSRNKNGVTIKVSSHEPYSVCFVVFFISSSIDRLSGAEVGPDDPFLTTDGRRAGVPVVAVVNFVEQSNPVHPYSQ